MLEIPDAVWYSKNTLKQISDKSILCRRVKDFRHQVSYRQALEDMNAGVFF